MSDYNETVTGREGYFIDPEIVEKAKQVDVLTYLQDHEPGNLVKLSSNNYCTKEHDSLKISNGKWYWFSRGFGGYSALDYLVKVEEVPFIRAVELISGVAAERKHFNPKPREQPPKKLLMPELSNNTDHVKRYLMKRGIDPEIIDYGIQHALIFETKEYHNAVFVGYDTKGIARYAAMRSTFTPYKGDITGSDKHFSFSLPGRKGAGDLHLFEAAIDLLSYASILKLEGKDWQEDRLLSLAGVFMPKRKNVLPVALEQYLKDHPDVKTIHLHLDNDEVGRGATEGIMNALAGKYELLDEPPDHGKDVNDALLYRQEGSIYGLPQGGSRVSQREVTAR